MALNSAFDPQKPNPSCMIASGEGATRGVFVELTSAVVIASPIFDRVDPGPCREPNRGERSRGKRAAPLLLVLAVRSSPPWRVTRSVGLRAFRFARRAGLELGLRVCGARG